MNDQIDGLDGEVLTEKKVKVKKPSMYRVLLHNDDYTSMEFVVYILQEVFNKSLQEATNIMLRVHHQGVGVCGIYPFEIAETKIQLVLSLAEKHSFPLRSSMEEV